MLVNGDELASGTTITADVLIIGAGPAGITLARELDGSGVDVVLLAAGGPPGPPQGVHERRIDPGESDFETPQTFGHRFGGGANEWVVRLPWMRRGVRLLPLAASDFEARAWVPHSGWPVSRPALEPYFERARTLLGLEEPIVGGSPGNGLLPLTAAGFTTGIDHIGRHEVLSEESWGVLRRSTNVRVVLHASAGCLEGSPDRVEHVVVDNGTPGRLTARGALVVLACGGFDNPRLLLSARGRAGLGSSHDVVGRYHMDHVRTITGTLVPRSPHLLDQLAAYDLRRAGPTSWQMAKIVPTDAAMAQHHLLNSAAMLLPLPSPAVRATFGRTKQALRDVAARARPEALPGPRELARLMTFAAGTGTKMVLRQRRFPPRTDAGWAALGGNAQRYASLQVEHQIEQAPDPGNRVTLSDGLDPFGRPKARLDWRWTELDLRSLAMTQRLLADGVAAADLGHLELAPWDGDTPSLTTPGGAFHPMGGTRMHANPRCGVVDADGQVHGVRNLFVCGSSTFTTGGYANPTMTIVALAIRLAQHVRQQLSGSTPGVAAGGTVVSER